MTFYMAISIPDRVIDYVLYYECGPNEKKTPNAWYRISSLAPGSLMSAVNWSASGNDIGDGAGQTYFGVTPNASKAVFGKYVTIDSPDKWLEVIKYFWNNSHASEAANEACATQIFQGYWGGWSGTCIKNTCELLRENCDDKTKAASYTNNGLKTLAALTNCFNNPMDAFVYIRASRIAYLRSCSNASKFANGWMRREFFAMQTDGLYVEPGTSAFTKYGFTPLADMERAAQQLKGDSSSGYQKLMDWGSDAPSNLTGENLDMGFDLPTPSNYGATSNGDSSAHNKTNISGNEITMGINQLKGQKGAVLGIHLNQK